MKSYLIKLKKSLVEFKNLSSVLRYEFVCQGVASIQWRICYTDELLQPAGN